MSSQRVQHCAKNLKFFLELTKGQEARLEYRQLKKNVIDLYHTEIPKELKGKGVSAQLCKEAFSVARDNNWKVVTSCPTAEKYVDTMASPMERKLVIKKLTDKKDDEDPL